MRWLEVRRHSVTKKGPARGRGSHLSAQGVALARAVGAELGQIAYVLTSAAPRAIETAVAMGVAVDDAVDLPSGYVPGEVGFHEQWAWAQPWVRYAELVARGGGLAAVARAHRAAWVQAVASVAVGEAALVVSHGGAIEPTLVACLPHAGHDHWALCWAAATAPDWGLRAAPSSTFASAERGPCQHPETSFRSLGWDCSGRGRYCMALIGSWCPRLAGSPTGSGGRTPPRTPPGPASP
jgi:broad specificity phosphatase PhoE